MIYAGMLSSNSVLVLEAASKTKFCGLDLGLEVPVLDYIPVSTVTSLIKVTLIDYETFPL